jgi:predicted RNA-binding Zn-ribbon protein involved in translation (DUF1610 family)
MSRFRQELDLVPRTAWAVAVCTWLGFFLLMMLLPFRVDPEGRHWPLAGKLAMSVLPGLPIFILVLLIGYVNADARRRGMRYVMWTLLAIFIPNAIGIILYFVLREPLLAHCTHCGAEARQGFAFCPKCGGALALACPQCRRAVEPGWSHCVHCGAVVREA